MPDRTDNATRSIQRPPAPEIDAVSRAQPADLNPTLGRGRSASPKTQIKGLLLVSLGAVLFIMLGFAYGHRSLIAMADFKPLFYGARCMLTGCDLYSQQQLQRLYFAEGDEPLSQKIKIAPTIVWSINSPATYMLVTPFAALPWRIANVLRTIATCAIFLLAAFLIWDLGSRSAPVASGFLVLLFLIGQELLIEIGNAAGLAVALCLIAVWCFLRKRFELAGVLCLAVSFAIKPHDAGFIWLYFLLAGGVLRKRAFQTLLCAAALSLPAILWAHHLGPDWMTELRHNFAITSMRGSLNDPGPAALDPRFHGAIIISLQSAISLFRDDPNFYNPLSYLMSGVLLLVWIVIGIRSRFSPSLAPLALAAISVLTLLPVYHRQHDTALLLLTIPAYALLWSEKQWLGRCALFITAGAAILLNNLTLQFLAIFSTPIYAGTSGIPGKMLALLFTRPAPIVLFVLALFYLSVYVVKARSLRLAPPMPSRSGS